MKRILRHESYGSADHGWLKTLFHFSFADYQNPDNIQFGVLRVLNDDLIQAGRGFANHPHRDMEIISYVVDGELTHADSMGHQQTIIRGQVQYMSAGTGVMHSEYNRGKETARLLQIWIMPDRKGHTPAYGDFRFEWEDRVNRLLPLVSSITGNAPVKIHQDAQFFVSSLEAGHSIIFPIQPKRQVYVVNIEGALDVAGEQLRARDAMEASDDALEFYTQLGAHFLLIEMAQPKA